MDGPRITPENHGPSGTFAALGIGQSVDLTDTAARAARDRLADRTDMLDKVGVLRCLPDDMHVTTTEAATFYEVDVELVRYHLKANRDEFDSDGYRVVNRAEFESEFGSLSNLDPRARSIGLFPRRAVLRLGMVLRDSVPARQVRDYLLDAESRERQPHPANLTRMQILEMAIDSERRALAAESEVKVLSHRIERDAPLVAKAEAHTASARAINRQTFAREVQAWGTKQDINILQEQVYELLRRKGMLIDGHRSDRNHATAQAVKSGWAWTQKDVTEDGHPTAVTMINPRGQDIAWKWIADYVRSHGTLALPPKITGGAA